MKFKKILFTIFILMFISNNSYSTGLRTRHKPSTSVRGTAQRIPHRVRRILIYLLGSCLPLSRNDYITDQEMLCPRTDPTLSTEVASLKSKIFQIDSSKPSRFNRFLRLFRRNHTPKRVD